MSCSAIPHSRKRSGYASSKPRTRQSEARSASSTTSSGMRRARSTSASPYASTTYSRRPRLACPGTTLRLGLERRGRELGLQRRHRLELDRPYPGEELVTRTLEALVVGRARVPAVRAAAVPQRRRVLHERDAPTLDRTGDEHLGPVVDGRQLGERAPQLRVVVAVARRHMPAERRELRLEVAEGEDLLRRLVGLKLVAVDDHGQPRQAVMGRTLQAPRSSGPPGARRLRP